MQAVQAVAGAPPSAASIPQQTSQTPSSNEISDSSSLKLTGTGTDHQAAEGPIDTGFKSTRQPVGKFQGIQVWGPYDAPGQLGIWGTDVCVDFDICVSDGACIDACPVNVYEWLDTPGHPASERKPFMIREKDCIFCLACENVCPPQAIKIFKK
jgi:NAD-dependent dihydropyrimidine dehydrogenase PreA subunit